MAGICIPHGRKTEATLAQEVSKTIKRNSKMTTQSRGYMIHILVHNSAPKGPTEVITRPPETRDQYLSDGTGPVDVGSQNDPVINVQR